MQDTVHLVTVNGQQPASSLSSGITTTVLNDSW